MVTSILLDFAAVGMFQFFLLLLAVFPHLLQSLTRWTHFLRLKARFHHVKRVGHEARKAAGCARAHEVPEVGVLALPGSNQRL